MEKTPGTFDITAQDSGTRGRTGRLTLQNAEIETPVFMPVGTQATVKTMTSAEVQELGFDLILGNTYHLLLRPGMETIQELGGLRKFMSWPGAILTDSGGYQVFSLANNVKIDHDGVEFQSHLDGDRLKLTPELATDMQLAMDSDIVMAFDECVRYPVDRTYAKEATERSFYWTERSFERFHVNRRNQNLFFGIVQGACDMELRRWSAEHVAGLECDGYAVGGLSVGEPMDLGMDVLAGTVPLLPEGSPRYLMGVGKLRDIYRAVCQGVDMFDCVLPTRQGRHGHVVTHEGELNLKNARFRTDASPIDERCRCRTCRDYSRAYLHHLIRAGEMTGMRLATHHNLWTYARFMESLREAIRENRLESFGSQLPPESGNEDPSTSSEDSN